MLEVRLLGQFDVQLAGTPIAIASRPAQSLMAYLLLNAGVPQRREKLAGLLWPDAAEANARRSLRQALWHIRKALTPRRPAESVGQNYLLADDLTITFDAGSEYWLDVAVLDGKVPDGASSADLIGVVSVYRGELLPGFYPEWVVLERERLQAVFEQKMKRLMDRLVEERRWPEVLEWGERWISLSHSPEPAYRALMAAHHSLGDMSSMAAVFQRCVQALRSDLGVEPSEQTLALYEQLVRQARQPSSVAAQAVRPEAAPASFPSSLPAQPTPFIGREQELAEVAARLADPACRLLTLTGPGGIGKTRLALQAAADQVRAFPQGVHFVPLAPLSSPDFLVSTIAEALRFSFYGGEDPKAQLHNYLRDKQTLLVMDNFEHLLDGAGLIADILAGAPDLKFLVTSQERLNLQGEWLLEIEGMRFPTSVQLDVDSADPNAYSAIQLFLQCARRVASDFALYKEDFPAVIRICQLVDGMPLGIELASAWVRALSCAEIAGEIERNLDFLTTSLRDVPERHRSLQAVFDHSWNRLSEEERRVFRRLSVFWGGFRREAAEQVAGASLPRLSALVDKSLLRRNASGRYEMHGLLRKYAQAKLLESGEADAVRARHLDFFLKLAEAAEPGLRRADQMEWLARLETEHDNMRAAMKWSLDGGALEAGLRLAGDLSRFWYLRGYWREGREWLERLLSPAGSAETAPEAVACAQSARAKALYGAGWLANEGEAEVPLYDESLALCREAGDKWGAAFSLRGLGARAVNQGEQERAGVLLDESLILFRELGDPWGIALVLFNLGWLAHDQGDYGRAETTWAESLDLFRQVGDRWGIAVSLGALGYLARLQNNYPRAAALSEESLALFRELGDKAGAATSLNRLGNVAFRRGDYQQATALLRESQALQHELGSQWGIVSSFSFLGLVACYQGDYERAREALEESLEHAREIGDKEDYAFILDYLGLVAHYQGDHEQATALWQECLALHRKQEDKANMAYALTGLGLVAHTQGDQKQATERLEESLALYRELGDKRHIAISLNGLGRAAHAQGDDARAAALFQESLTLRKEVGDKQGLAETLEGLAGVTGAQGQPEKTARLLGAAQALREMIGAPVPPVERAEYDRNVAVARAGLDEATFTAAWAEGRTMPLKKVIDDALMKLASPFDTTPLWDKLP